MSKPKNKRKNKRKNKKPVAADVYLHPTATTSPDLIRQVENLSGRKAVIIDGVPSLVMAVKSSKYLPIS